MITIDGTANTPNQDGELNLTGTVSYIGNNQNANCFFDLLGSQNPSTANPKPKNWFYYWTLTTANQGTMNYAAAGNSHCDMIPPNYPCYLTDGDSGPYTTPSVGQNANTNLNHIDSFAWTCRHEWRHHNQFNTWWGAGGYVGAQDPDGDEIPSVNPNAVEQTLAAADGGPFDPTKYDTFPNDEIDNDLERNAAFTQGAWNVGSANASDWAHPGNQWP